MTDHSMTLRPVSVKPDDRRKRPLVVGIGGSPRAGSNTELALRAALGFVEAADVDTLMFGGAFLGSLPIFDPGSGATSPEHIALSDAIRRSDGVIIATPSYHGSISGAVKNALDTLSLDPADPAPYFHGRPVGTIITFGGHQAAGTTLTTLRTIIHALRGWPTSIGAALCGGSNLFDKFGVCLDPRDAWQLSTLAQQAVEFAAKRAIL